MCDNFQSDVFWKDLDYKGQLITNVILVVFKSTKKTNEIFVRISALAEVESKKKLGYFIKLIRWFYSASLLTYITFLIWPFFSG